MKKLKVILVAVVILGTIGAIVLYMIPWGTAESEVKELEIVEESVKVESGAGVEINDITELKGKYVTYDVDSATSELMFSVDALQGTVGKFKQFSASYNSGGDLSQAEINVSIDVSSIYTANSMRDESIKDKGFFEVSNFPEINYKSSSIELVDTGYVAHGTINMMGLEKEIDVPFLYKGKSTNYKKNEVAIFEGEFSLDRTQYGMEHTTSVGDVVSVNFVVQLEKQNE